ncbi:Uncharacterised protein [Serratia fonticola]|nr:Uncharacterised protein [Serratia fonticola]
MRKYRLPDSRQDGISPTGRGNRSSSILVAETYLTTALNQLSFIDHVTVPAIFLRRE